MQVVIALPRLQEIDRLDIPVCGVPLLRRVITTAFRSGGSRVLLLLPPACPSGWLYDRLRTMEAACIETVEIDRQFDPGKPEDWDAIGQSLDDRFLWMPYDCVAYNPALTELLETAARHPDAAVRFSGVADIGSDRCIFERPTVLLKSDRLDGDTSQFEVAPVNGQPGVSVHSPAEARAAEAELVRRSGKATDGIHSGLNRKLCRPAVRWLSHTSVTPNAVTFGGLAVAVLAGLCFARGSWPWNVAGAALFFISGLFDEVDGMLARLKFQESAFGCWLETMVDYATYLLVFAGMTVGGYRRGGWLYLVLGAALLFGSVLSFFVISVQRKLAAPASRPTEYYQRHLATLERDAGDPISRTTRTLQFLLRKGVLIHYILLFALLDLLPVVLFLGAFGANVAWIVTLYLSRRLYRPNKTESQRLDARRPAPTEVER